MKFANSPEKIRNPLTRGIHFFSAIVAAFKPPKKASYCLNEAKLFLKKHTSEKFLPMDVIILQYVVYPEPQRWLS